jgi:hypothetical protein
MNKETCCLQNKAHIVWINVSYKYALGLKSVKLQQRLAILQ